MADKPLTLGEAMRKHSPEYLIEAWGLGTFMVLAGLTTTLLEYPNLPIRQAIEDADLRRMLIGLALPAFLWEYLWIYFTAPVVGMQLAVEVFRLGKLGREKFCAKLNHDPAYRCIHCGHEPAQHAVQSGRVVTHG